MNTTLSTVSEKHHSKPCGFTQRARISAPPCYLFILRVTSYMGMLGNIMSLVTIESLQWQLYQVVDQGFCFINSIDKHMLQSSCFRPSAYMCTSVCKEGQCCPGSHLRSPSSSVYGSENTLRTYKHDQKILTR